MVSFGANCFGADCFGATPNLPTNIKGFRGFDSSIILIKRSKIPRSMGKFRKSLSQAMLVGIMLVGRLGVTASVLTASATATVHASLRASRRKQQNKKTSCGVSLRCLRPLQKALLIIIIMIITSSNTNRNNNTTHANTNINTDTD